MKPDIWVTNSLLVRCTHTKVYNNAIDENLPVSYYIHIYILVVVVGGILYKVITYIVLNSKIERFSSSNSIIRKLADTVRRGIRDRELQNDEETILNEARYMGD